MHADDVALCRIYGQMSREHFGDVPWDTCLEQLAEGWLRVRRDPRIAWRQAKPLVQAFWELTPG